MTRLTLIPTLLAAALFLGADAHARGLSMQPGPAHANFVGVAKSVRVQAALALVTLPEAAEREIPTSGYVALQMRTLPKLDQEEAGELPTLQIWPRPEKVEAFRADMTNELESSVPGFRQMFWAEPWSYEERNERFYGHQERNASKRIYWLHSACSWQSDSPDKDGSWGAEFVVVGEEMVVRQIETDQLRLRTGTGVGVDTSLGRLRAYGAAAVLTEPGAQNEVGVYINLGRPF